MDLALEKLLVYEFGTCQRQLAKLEEDLLLFEQRYARTSVQFYDRYLAGKGGDDLDAIEWASLFQMANRLRKRIALLKSSV
jgi:hypothetical protein